MPEQPDANQRTEDQLVAPDVVTARRTFLKRTGAGLAGGLTLVGSARGQETAEFEWFIEDCQAAIALVPVDAGALADHLPDGFAPQPPKAFGLPEDPANDGVMGVEAFTCETSAALDGTIEDVPYMSYFAPVEPPANRADSAARWHFVKWDVLIADEGLRAEFQARGLPAVGGWLFDSVERSNEQFSFDFLGALGGKTHRLTGNATQPEGGPEEYTFVEFTPTEAGVATWEVTVTDAATLVGGGKLKMESGSLPAEVVGADVTEAPMIAGDLSFSDVTITVPTA